MRTVDVNALSDIGMVHDVQAAAAAVAIGTNAPFAAIAEHFGLHTALMATAGLLGREAEVLDLIAAALEAYAQGTRLPAQWAELAGVEVVPMPDEYQALADLVRNRDLPALNEARLAAAAARVSRLAPGGEWRPLGKARAYGPAVQTAEAMQKLAMAAVDIQVHGMSIRAADDIADALAVDGLESGQIEKVQAVFDVWAEGEGQ